MTRSPNTQPQIPALLSPNVTKCHPCRPPPPLTPLLPTSSTSLRSSLKDPSNTKLTVLDTGVDPSTPNLGGRVTCRDLSGSSDFRMSKVEDLAKRLEARGVKPSQLGEEEGVWMEAVVSFSSLLPDPAKKRLDSAAKKKFKKSHDAALLELEKARPKKPGKEATEEECDKWMDYEGLKSELEKGLKKHDASPPGDFVAFYLSPSGSMKAVLPGPKVLNVDFDVPLMLDEESQATFTVLLALRTEEGAKAQIITDVGAHGTHVACIAAGADGVCPGALVESYRVGDARLGSMETTRSIAAAFSHLTGDVVNLSYGEAVSDVGEGYLIPLIEEMVQKKKKIFLSSAGNSGPALCTVGAPGGGFSKDIIR